MSTVTPSLLFILCLSTFAARLPRVDQITGGAEAFTRDLKAYSERLLPYQKARLRAGEREVLFMLSVRGCATYLDERNQQIDRPEARLVKDLIGLSSEQRKAAFYQVIRHFETHKQAREPIFAALLLLMRADVRPKYVEMFLRLQRSWPASFVEGLLYLAAEGNANDRRYVVGLIRAAKNQGNATVRRKFNLEGDVEAALDRVLTHPREALYGEKD